MIKFLAPKGFLHSVNEISRYLAGLGVPREDLIVKWGSMEPLSSNIRLAKKVIILNDGFSMNKVQMAKVLQTNNMTAHQYIKDHDDEYPCIVRPEHHTRGKNFFICFNKYEQDLVTNSIEIAKENWYSTPIFDKEAEYRVHVAWNKCLAVQKKEHEVDTIKHNPIIWNYDNGWRYHVIRWNEIPKGLCPIAVKALSLFNLDFGAVDIMMQHDKYVVAEINRAPNVEDYTAERYAHFFHAVGNNIIKKSDNHKKFMWRFNARETAVTSRN